MIDAAKLIYHAQRYSRALGSDNAFSNFIVRLQVTDELEVLRTVVTQFALAAEIALPTWQRLVVLAGDDAQTLLQAASAFYSHGYDEPAAALIEDVLSQDPQSIAGLELKAALTPDPAQRRIIFEQILKINPGNRTAVDNLILLDRPK